MCGGGAPAPVRSDPEADADRIAAEAAATANAEQAGRRRSRRRSSLLAAGDPTLGAPQQSTVLGYGKQTLGG